MLRRLMGWWLKPKPPAQPDHITPAIEAWEANMRATHLIAPVNGEIVWVPKSPTGSRWLVWRYMQMDPDLVGTRYAQGPTVKDASGNMAHDPSRLPGQVW